MVEKVTYEKMERCDRVMHGFQTVRLHRVVPVGFSHSQSLLLDFGVKASLSFPASFQEKCCFDFFFYQCLLMSLPMIMSTVLPPPLVPKQLCSALFISPALNILLWKLYSRVLLEQEYLNTYTYSHAGLLLQ